MNANWRKKGIVILMIEVNQGAPSPEELADLAQIGKEMCGAIGFEAFICVLATMCAVPDDNELKALQEVPITLNGHKAKLLNAIAGGYAAEGALIVRNDGWPFEELFVPWPAFRCLIAIQPDFTTLQITGKESDSGAEDGK